MIKRIRKLLGLCNHEWKIVIVERRSRSYKGEIRWTIDKTPEDSTTKHLVGHLEYHRCKRCGKMKKYVF